VIMWDSDSTAISLARDKLARSHPLGKVSGRTVDVSDATAVDAAAIGGCDILVCSAGIAGQNAPTSMYPVSEFERIIAVNLTGLFLCNRAVLPHMIKRGYGRIVNISSVSLSFALQFNVLHSKPVFCRLQGKKETQTRLLTQLQKQASLPSQRVSPRRSPVLVISRSIV
jgi:NAD(P)-dependent dehydrogenase (short-subunit alcohol dehydrogenase family)